MRQKVVLGLLVGSLAMGGAALGAGCGSGGAVSFGTAGSGAGAGGSTTSSAAGTGGTSSSGGMCPPAAGDTACVACTKQNCCADAIACLEDKTCTCWEQCYLQHPGDYSFCLTQCPAPDGVTQALSSCVAASCAGPCNGVTSSSNSSGSTSSSGGVLCTPTGSDSACTVCTKQSCCNQVNTCAADQSCLCYTGCLDQGTTATQCAKQCGSPDGTTNALLVCAAANCGNKCP